MRTRRVQTTAAVEIAAKWGTEYDLVVLGGKGTTASVMAVPVSGGKGEADAAKTESVRFEASRTGWHGLRAVRGRSRDTLAIVATWLTDALGPPETASGEKLTWLLAAETVDAEEARRIEQARELARYFILGWSGTFDTDIGRELHERKDDPYPELSELGLENERLLVLLSDEPERLDEEGWSEIAEIGRRTGILLGWDEAETR